MASELDGVQSEPGPLLLHLQQMTEVIAKQNAALISLQAERDTAWSERDAAQAEIEKLRLLIRQLQRGTLLHGSVRLASGSTVGTRSRHRRVKHRESVPPRATRS